MFYLSASNFYVWIIHLISPPQAFQAKAAQKVFNFLKYLSTLPASHPLRDSLAGLSLQKAVRVPEGDFRSYFSHFSHLLFYYAHYTIFLPVCQVFFSILSKIIVFWERRESKTTICGGSGKRNHIREGAATTPGMTEERRERKGEWRRDSPVKRRGEKVIHRQAGFKKSYPQVIHREKVIHRLSTELSTVRKTS